MEPNSLATPPEAPKRTHHSAIWLGALVLVLVAVYVFIFNKNNFLGNTPASETSVPTPEVQTTIMEKIKADAREQAAPPAEQKKVMDTFAAEQTPPPSDSQKQQINNALNAH